jgi:hypothetical protein
VPEHLADDGQGDAAHERVAGERVAEVVDPEVGDADDLADRSPGVVEACELQPVAGADDAALLLVAGLDMLLGAQAPEQDPAPSPEPGIEPWAYLRDLLCLLPSWPARRILELAPAFWKQTREQPDTQQRLAANVFRVVTLADHQPEA